MNVNSAFQCVGPYQMAGAVFLLSSSARVTLSALDGYVRYCWKGFYGDNALLTF